MVLESRITWEKLCLELELISKEEPKSLIPLLIGINCILNLDDSHDWCSRTVNFMVYELAALCENKTESERFEILNQFFFETRDFQIKNVGRSSLTSSEMLIRTILEERAGASLPILILYLHLAHCLDLPIFAIHQPRHHVLKWVRGSKASFIDLAESARILDDEELLQIINRDVRPVASINEMPQLETLSFKALLTKYLHDLRRIYLNEKKDDLTHAVLSMLLKLEPTNLKYLGERALLRKQMGHHREAMQDLKRYFSFTDISQAPSEIQLAARELQALTLYANPEMIH